MIKKYIKCLILLLCFGLTLLTVGCKDEEEKDAENYYSVKNNSYCENVFADIFKWINNAQLLMEDSLYKTSKSSYNTTLFNTDAIHISLTPNDTTTWPKILTINFGSTNIMCLDGKNRKGKITAAVTGKFNKQGTVITAITSEYYVNNLYVEGTIKLICAGLNSAGHLLFRENVTNAKIVTPDGVTYWECDRDRELISGKQTPWPNIYDDIYKITGKSSGTDVTGRLYEAKIINPLKHYINCKWMQEGSLEITPDGLSIRSVDYGNDGCNPDAKITIADKTYNFIMIW